MESVYWLIGLCIFALLAFALLTVKDLVKYLIKKSRDKKSGAVQVDNVQKPTFPKTLKRNLTLIPFGVLGIITILAVLTLLTMVIFPTK